jgi:hypothetical protein
VGTTHAVLIGIEKYQQQAIPDVEFAEADVSAMRDVLVQNLGVPVGNITVWLNSDATQAVFKNDLPYMIRQLRPGDRLILFYAGHGFFSNGTNRLTAWDSHPTNFAETTVSLEPALLAPLKNQPTVSSLVFIDACAAELKAQAFPARDVISDMTAPEFESLIRSAHHSGVYFACSPNEKAYPSTMLKHGIWTYHLLRALQGEADGALDRDRWITGDSLRDYLAVAIPAFIRSETTIQGQQRPYAILSSSGPFGIHQIPLPDDPLQALPKVELKFVKARFGGVDTIAFRRLEGFNKKLGHFVPEYASEKASAFGKKLLDPEIVAELEEMKDLAKDVLNLGRRDVAVASDGEAGGSIDTDFFRYAVTTRQDPDDPADMRIVRSLILRKPLKELPGNFDDIFVARLDRLTIPVEFEGVDYEDIADSLEKFARENNGNFQEHSNSGVITLTFANRNLTVIFDSERKVLRFSVMGVSGPVRLSNILADSVARTLMGGTVTMLGKPTPPKRLG